jgi:hypothetical protein
MTHSSPPFDTSPAAEAETRRKGTPTHAAISAWMLAGYGEYEKLTATLVLADPGRAFNRHPGGRAYSLQYAMQARGRYRTLAAGGGVDHYCYCAAGSTARERDAEISYPESPASLPAPPSR